MTLKGRSKAARDRKLSESTGYRVDVVGILWQGTEGSTSYTFSYLPTPEQITQRAGDFQSILDYQVTAVTSIQYVDGYRVIRRVVEPFECD